MAQESPLLYLTIEEVLARWPETAVVFKQYQMACIGCAISQFYPITDAAAVYQIPLDTFILELETVIKKQ